MKCPVDNLPQRAEGNDARFLAAGFSENSTSDDSDESDEHDDLDLADRLKHWVFGYNIPSNATTSLLDILHPYHPTLPRDWALYWAHQQEQCHVILEMLKVVVTIITLALNIEHL